MTNQPPAGSGSDPAQPSHQPYGPPADWNSPLWGEPQTVAAGWRSAQPEAPAPFQPGPPPPPRRRTRALLISAVAVLAVLALAGAFLVNGALGRDRPSAAVAPTPSISAPTAVPTPSPTDPSAQDPSAQDPSQQDPSQQDPSQEDPSQQDPSQQDPSQQDPSQQQPSQQDPSQQSPDNPTGTSSSKLTEKQKAAVAAVTPGLVDIVSTIGYDGEEGAGTGEILTSDGTILTNHHVVAGATAIKVTVIATGKSYSAKVIGYDSTHDIAVIKLVDASGLTVAPLGDSSTVSVGDAVVGLGNALGKGGTPTAAAGKVTALNQSITAQDSSNSTSERLSGLIETDAPIQPGDSGGSLIDNDGKVVGIITAGSTDGSDPTIGAAASDETATAGFAIPINQAREIADQIIAGQSSSTIHIGGTPFLGVQVSDLSSGIRGVTIAGTVNGSAAHKAGLVAGDTITAINDTKVTGGDSLKAALSDLHPGDTITVHWKSESGTSHSAQATLTEGPVG